MNSASKLQVLVFCVPTECFIHDVKHSTRCFCPECYIQTSHQP